MCPPNNSNSVQAESRLRRCLSDIGWLMKDQWFLLALGACSLSSPSPGVSAGHEGARNYLSLCCSHSLRHGMHSAY